MYRRAIIGVAALVAVVAFVVYLRVRPPPGVESMGDGDSATIAWLSLATAVAGLLTAVVNLVLELRKGRA